MFSRPWDKDKEKLKELYNRMYELESEDSSGILPGSEQDLLSKEINTIIEGPYSEAVFRYYSKRKPRLKRTLTGEILSWKDAFGESYEDVSKSLRHSLVGLIEGGGRYTFL